MTHIGALISKCITEVAANTTITTTNMHTKQFKQYKIEKFYKSIKSRLIVAEVIKRCYY